MSWLQGIGRIAVLLAFAVVPTSSALAWSHQGHMTTGAIAFDDLARVDARIIGEVERIMSAHPDYERFRTNLEGLSGNARSRELFKLMARWPDDVRGTRYDHPTWHYALRVVSSWSVVIGAEYGDARKAFAANLRIASDPRAAPGKRATAFCWLFHIIGDMQQPLHAGHWASIRFPLTDRGGSKSFIRRGPGGPAIQMHEFWDFAIDTRGAHSQQADLHALRIERQYPRANLAELHGPSPDPFSQWASESARLAFLVAYRKEGLEAVSVLGGTPAASTRYVSIAQRLASRRLADGGYRIADVLRTVFRVSR